MPDRESFILDSGEKQCPFLSWDKEFSKATCVVYESRPQACRDFIASLSWHECQEGLKELRSEKSILFPKDLYPAKNERKQLYSVLREIEE